MTETRIYVVTAKAGKQALVRAASKAQAIRHAARNEFSAHVASQDDLVTALTLADVAVEIAGEEANE